MNEYGRLLLRSIWSHSCSARVRLRSVGARCRMHRSFAGWPVQCTCWSLQLPKRMRVKHARKRLGQSTLCRPFHGAESRQGAESRKPNPVLGSAPPSPVHAEHLSCGCVF